jgi:CheY-like chemotaxis protein
MLQRVADVINFRVDEKRQKFSVHVDPAIPHTLIGDDQRLAQVITNLLGNAVKFTPEKGFIHLEATLSSEQNGICTLLVSVSDSGIGISEEQKARLFASFEQAEAGISRKYGGTGLGLVISKNIVEMMGGGMWVESELGKGSTFSFTVCLARGQEKQKKLLAPELNWKNIRLLAVDDTPEVLTFFMEAAKHLGIACDTASTGEEAVSLIEKNGPYNIYFVDWKMPGMNGIELASFINEKSAENSVIIMISATDWSAIQDSAHEAGINKFLPKPLFISSIADCINECLGSPVQVDGPSGYDAKFEGYCILLAEDVEINREVVLALLEPTNLKIDCAANGVEAVNMFIADPLKYDMIFMDVQMPDMDGYTATKQIRESGVDRARDIPIVAMTANVFKEDIEKSIEAGMNAHVGKPLDMEEVIGALQKYLKH